MKSKVGIADAFGRLVEVGDTVVYKGKQKYLEKGRVTKVTHLGVTEDHKVNIRSERIYRADKGMRSLFKGERGGNPSQNAAISEETLDELKADSMLLNALMAAGVDNWEGYSIACNAIEDEEDD